MKRLFLIPILALALFVGMAVGPGKAVADGCAASFAVENAFACGNGGYTLIWQGWVDSQRYGCLYEWNNNGVYSLYWTYHGYAISCPPNP